MRQTGQSESRWPGFQLIVMNVPKIQELTVAGRTWLYLDLELVQFDTDDGDDDDDDYGNDDAGDGDWCVVDRTGW